MEQDIHCKQDEYSEALVIAKKVAAAHEARLGPVRLKTITLIFGDGLELLVRFVYSEAAFIKASVFGIRALCCKSAFVHGVLVGFPTGLGEMTASCEALFARKSGIFNSQSSGCYGVWDVMTRQTLVRLSLQGSVVYLFPWGSVAR